MKNKLKTSFSFLAVVVITIVLLSSLSACSHSNNDNYIDLSKMNSTMVYSQVNDMVTNPSHYKGKTVKAKGTCSVYTDKSTGKTYYSVIIKDATACCSQGLEFVLKSNNYPQQGKTITVEGTFGTYKESNTTYCRLSSAKLV